MKPIAAPRAGIFVQGAKPERSCTGRTASSGDKAGGETVRCEQLDIIQTNVPECLVSVNDSRCFAVSEAPPPVAGYIYTDPGDAQAWLIEALQDITVHGSTIEPCELADDGVTWMPNVLCDCAGEAYDETGA